MCVDPDPYWEYGSVYTKLLNTDPVRIRIHNFYPFVIALIGHKRTKAFIFFYLLPPLYPPHQKIGLKKRKTNLPALKFLTIRGCILSPR